MSSRLLIGLALVATTLLALVVAEEAPAEGGAPSDVVELTDDNFDTEMAKHDMLLVEFYAPWCGHCKRLAPEYEKAATELAKEGLKIAKVDADAQKKSGGRFGVSGFPTLKLFRFGEVAEDFNGGRTADDIVKYVREKSKVAVNKELTSLKEVKDLTKAANVKEPVLIGYFSSKDHVDFKIFRSVVTGFGGAGIHIYHTATPSVLEGVGFLSEGSSIQMFRPNSKPFKVQYRGTLFKQTLKEWILENAMPAVGPYTPDSSKLYTQTGDSVIRVVAEDADLPKDTTAVLTALAGKYQAKNNIRFATSKSSDYASEVEAHCTKGAKVCVLASEGAKTKRNRVFGMQTAFSAANLESFVEDFIAKKLTVKVKSEAAGAAPKAGEVATIVGTTFQEHVVDVDKSVLVEFYAPWCGHCKNLAPKYDDLAKELGDQFDKVVIAKFDQTANDLPADYKSQYHVEGFPTLYWAPKGSKKSPVKYEGKREVEDMKKWVLEHLK